jgi:DNA primase catalytic core
MARIPEQELERLKREIDLVALVRSKGVKLEPHGKDLIGLCPFHDDKEPSLIVTPDKNLWHCLGACNTGGSTIDWIMKAEGVSFRHAVELLRSGNASSLVASDKILGKNTVPRLQAPVALDADDQTVLRQVIDYYHETLKRSPVALQYLEGRGITSEEAFTTFRIGYADRTLGLRLPHKNRKEGAEMRGRLERLGVYRESGHEHFNGSVVFPVCDENGLITEIYGRKIRDDLRTGTAYHTYLPGPHRGFWNPKSLAAKEIILCEAIIDALSFWVNGYRNVTAAYGVNGFTDEMLKAFIDRRVQKVYIAFDRDEAGEKAAERIAATLTGEGIECLRVQFPKGMDANEYACTMKPAAKSLQVLIHAAAWMGKRNAPAPVPAQEHANALESTPTPDVDLQKQTAEPEPVAEEPPPAEPEPPADADFLSLRQAQGDALAASSPLPEALPAAEIVTEPTPEPQKINVPCRINGEDIEITLGDRSYRVRGLQRNLSYEALKVNVRVLQGDKYYIDTLDVYNARHRTAFINAAAEELRIETDTLKRDVGRVLLKLEELQEQNIKATLKPEKPEVKLTEEERKAALALLRDPRLLDRIRADVRACGIVGEEINALTGFVAAVSRKLERPLGIIVQSSSAAGKTSLMDAILAFMPSEERIKYSAMTGQSLFYMGETDLKHKILAIVEEEGAERASYALKLLQSEGEISIASTGKEPSTGKLVTHEYRVEGPVMIFLTTTAVTIDEELQNRCIILTIDESREQTQAIQKLQREMETVEGLITREKRKQVLAVHRNAQRLLRPVEVVNPYAPRLTFLDDRTRTRRDQMKYLWMIKAIALLHQYQRPRKRNEKLELVAAGKEYIEVMIEDIEVANMLANEVLGRSLDELSPQTRRLLLLLDAMVKEGCEVFKMRRSDFRFTRKDVRKFTHWSDFQVHTHLSRLVSLEYVAIRRGAQGSGFGYELVYDGKVQDGRPFLLGLIDVEELRKEQACTELAEREEKKRLNKKPVAVEAKVYEYDESSLGVNAESLGVNAESLGVNAESLGRFCPQLAPV